MISLRRAADRGARILLIPALAALLARPALASDNGDFSSANIGTFGSPELNLGVGAQGIAMGGAMSAVADDATAIHWNPAGLALIPTGSASFMHSLYLGDISYDYLGYGQRINDHQVLAASIEYVDYGAIDQYDINDVSEGTFHPRSYLYTVAFAQTVHDIDEGGDLEAGFALKALQSTIVDTAWAYAGDVGFLAKIPADIPTKAAFVIQNIGSGQKFDQNQDALPLQARGGTSVSLDGWTLSLDLVAPRGNYPYGAAGVEYSTGWTDKLIGSLRAGYNSLDTANGPGGLTGFSFGLGLKMMGLSLDYAVVPFGDLGLTNQISLSYALPSFEEE